MPRQKPKKHLSAAPHNRSPASARSGEMPRAAAYTATQKRALIVVHNHPQFFPGGAEILAYDLFKAMRDQADYIPFFMASAGNADRKMHTGTPFQTLPGVEDEILFWGDAFDYFYQSQRIASFMHLDFKNLLLDLKPGIIHFHHTMRLGLEALRIARDTLPNVKIVYTLHEFILMCHRDGQMVRTFNNELCETASPTRCHKCFPDISSGQFMMRETFIKAHLDLVDQFISPSEFLAKRFIAWGIPEHKMTVMENGREVVPPAPQRHIAKGGARNVFGYFGQINPYKGAMLLLKAAEHLANEGFNDFRIELFGNVEMQSKEFQDEFFAFLDEYRDVVNFNGKYKNGDIAELIQAVDWVVVPSTWWENSPLVIQEVFMHRRPIICSDIGGMAEKVEDGRTGLHFKVRNAINLARTLRRACSEEGLWQKLSANIGPRLSIEECARQHTALYDRLINTQK